MNESLSSEVSSAMAFPLICRAIHAARAPLVNAYWKFRPPGGRGEGSVCICEQVRGFLPGAIVLRPAHLVGARQRLDVGRLRESRPSSGVRSSILSATM